MMRSFPIGMLAACLALATTGCIRSPRVTFYTLEPAARIEAAAPAGSGTGMAVTAVAGAAGTGARTTGAGTTDAGTGAGTAPVTVAPAPATPAAASSATAAPDSAAAAPTVAHPGTARATAAAAAPAIVVGPVTLPELVDRPQLVVRVAANRVAILESQRWAEPLNSEIPRVIAEDLGRLLGSSRVSSYLQHSGPAADFRVLLDIERFEASPGEAVSVEAGWSLHRGAAGTPETGRIRVREPVRGEGYDALVAAYGRALLAVSADLARAIQADAAGGR